MYRSPSPYAAPAESQYNSAPHSPGGGPQITPGSITYTTSIGPDGRVVYHPFKAVPASYQTPTGIVTGIQWIPAEATQILPAGAQPASTEFAQAWSRGNLSKEDQKALREWQRSEEKRRKREEKDSMKMLREKDRYNQSRYDNDPDLRIARERDAASANSLQRRKSFSQGFPPSTSVGFPSTSPNPGGYPPGFTTSDRSGYGAPGAYPPSPNAPSPGLGYQRERKYSIGGTLSEQFADLGLDRDDRLPSGPLARPRKYSTHEAAAERSRRMSGNFGLERPRSVYENAPGAFPVPPSDSAAGFRAGVPYSNPSPNLRSVDPPYMQAPRPASPYGAANYPPPISASQDPYGARAASPYHRAPSPFGHSASPFAAGGGDVYPPGHIMEGRPIGSARSRATTPVPGMPPSVAFPSSYSQAGMQGGMSPHMSPMMVGAPPSGTLAAPECFSRPINAAHPYTPFEPMRIQDMDLFLESLPRMPVVLQTHDVYGADWSRLMDDVRLAWSGRLPIPGASMNGRPPKRATLVAKLLELWNHSFFERRGVELVLYKGRERRSGSQYGVIDIPHDDYDDDTSSSSSDSGSSGEDDQPLSGFYGGYPPDMPDARQRRRVAKAEKRRRRKEKKYRRRQREKRYSLWLSCLPQGGPGGAGSTGFMPTTGSLASGTFPPHSPAMGMPGPGFRGPSPVPGYTNNPTTMSTYPGMMQQI